VDRNERRPGTQREYVDSDTKWYIEKSPDSQGYDNLGNPIYWHLKDTPIVAHLFSIAAATRPQADIRRSDFASDNLYVDALVADVLSTPKIPTVDVPLAGQTRSGAAAQDSILHTELAPNSGTVQVRTDGPSLVSFNDNYAPGWDVFVDGKKAPLIHVERLFMGAAVQQGTHTVTFRFRPVRVIAALLAPYAALIAAMLLAW
jgi:hypothetical protein